MKELIFSYIPAMAILGVIFLLARGIRRFIDKFHAKEARWPYRG
jgi:hypothetical protein